MILILAVGCSDYQLLPAGGAIDALYAQSGDTLYAVDPDTYAVTEIGAFAIPGDTLASSINDIAVDGDGRMIAITNHQSFLVDPTTAELTPLAEHDGWTDALTFLSDGRLVAGGDSTMWDVDPETGEFSGAYTFADWAFAGDMVDLPDGQLYCSMSAPTDESGASSIVVVDPATDAVHSAKSTGIGALFGVGYAQGKLFGFSSDGAIYTIDQATGNATQVANPGIQFFGAATNPWRWVNDAPHD